MRVISFILVFFIILWSSFWWIASRQMENSVLRWFDQGNIAQERKYDKLITTGYPNRVDISIDNFSITSNSHNLSFSAELIQLLSLVYNNKHFINIIKPPIKIEFNNNHINISGLPIKSSIKTNSANEPIVLISEGKKLNFQDQKDNIWMLNDFLLAIETETPEIYKTHLTVHNITIPANFLGFSTLSSQVNRKIEKITFNSQVVVNKKSKNASKQHKRIKITDLNMEIAWGLADIDLEGDFQLSNKDALNGSFKVTINNWQNFLSVIEKENLLKRKLYKKIKAGLTFLASQTTFKKERITLPILIKDNQVFLGPLKIGKINLKLQI
ncbi:MAG: DUF2125 domain-containing protein [Paracoccaceae bacterium]|nr:DUF2125 domain-containing protein [Paracoccaceae bacterium]